MTNPYADHAEAYRRAGWAGTLLLPHARKSPPPTGFTGEGGAWPTNAQVEEWAAQGGNIGLRLPANVVALDVDKLEPFMAYVAEVGPLPPTWRSVGARPPGHLYFRLPDGVSYRDLLAPAGKGFDLLRYNHRYSVVWPSRHPDGGTYTWVNPNGQTLGPGDAVPRLHELPLLPPHWVEALSAKAPAVTAAPTGDVTWDQFSAGPAQLGEPIHDNHDDTLARFTASLCARGMRKEEALILALARAQDVVGGDPRRPFTERDFERWWRGAEAKFTPAVVEEPVVEFDEETGTRKWRTANWRELAAGPPEPVEWIVPGILASKRGHVIYSASGVGKSLLVDELALAIVRGGDFLGQRCRKGVVGVIDHENDPHGETWDRLKRMGADPEELDDLHLLSFPEIDPADTASGGETVLQFAQDIGASLIVFDTATRTIKGEENSNDTWAAWDRHTGARLRAAGVAFLRLDHSGKDGSRGARGGSNKISDVHFAWELECIDEEAQEFRLTSRKNRTLLPSKVITFRREDTPLLRSVLTESDWSTIQVRKETALWEALDRLGVPADAGRPTCVAALTRARVQYDTNLLADVVRARKAQLNAFSTRPEWAPDPDRGGLVLGQGNPDGWAGGQPRVA